MLILHIILCFQETEAVKASKVCFQETEAVKASKVCFQETEAVKASKGVKCGHSRTETKQIASTNRRKQIQQQIEGMREELMYVVSFLFTRYHLWGRVGSRLPLEESFPLN